MKIHKTTDKVANSRECLDLTMMLFDDEYD